MKKIYIICIAILIAMPVFGEIKSSNEINLSTGLGYRPEAEYAGNSDKSYIREGVFLDGIEISYTRLYKMPFMQGTNDLTKNNWLAWNFGFGFSPSTGSISGNIKWSPLALIEIDTGIRLGTSWMTTVGDDILFGTKYLPGSGFNDRTGNGYDMFGNGIDLGVPDLSGMGLPPVLGNSHPTVGGLFHKYYLGTKIQFDFEVIFPGDWTHIVIQTYHQLNYSAWTKASNNDYWFYGMDEGLNRNGINYEGYIALGYMTPKIPYHNFTAGVLNLASSNVFDGTPRDNKNGGQWKTDAGLRFNFNMLTQIEFKDFTIDLEYLYFKSFRGLDGKNSGPNGTWWTFDKETILGISITYSF